MLLYALPGRLDAWQDAVAGADASRASSAWHCLTTTDMDGVEPFGFADGISQPQLDWERERAARDDEQLRLHQS